MHRVGYNANAPAGRHLSNDERRQVRKQIDGSRKLRKEKLNG